MHCIFDNSTPAKPFLKKIYLCNISAQCSPPRGVKFSCFLKLYTGCHPPSFFLPPGVTCTVLSIGLPGLLSAVLFGVGHGGMVIPDHITEMTAFGYSAVAQHNWSTFGKSFNLSALLDGHARFDFRGTCHFTFCILL